MDGTLTDSMGRFGQIAASVMARYYGVSIEWGLFQYKNTSGLPFQYQLERLFPGDARNRQAMIDFEQEKALSYWSSPFYPDMESTLQTLRDEGLFLAVSSNNDHDLLMQKLGNYKELFDLVLGFRPGFLKGQDHFSRICQVAEASFQHLLFVGDSLHDGRMALDNDISFAAKLGTFTKEDFEKNEIPALYIEKLSELIPLLTQTENADDYSLARRRLRRAAR